MSKKFDINQKQKLDSPRRREALPPKETLIKFGLTPSDIFADIGCGIGYFSIPAAEILANSGKVFALDISEEMLAEVKKASISKDLSNIELVTSEEYDLKLSDSSISYAFSCNVLHEIKDLPRFIKELVRIMQEQGKLVIIEWNDLIADWGPPAGHRITSACLIEMLEASGLHVDAPVDIAGYFYGLLCRKDISHETKAN